MGVGRKRFPKVQERIGDGSGVQEIPPKVQEKVPP